MKFWIIAIKDTKVKNQYRNKIFLILLFFLVAGCSDKPSIKNGVKSFNLDGKEWKSLSVINEIGGISYKSSLVPIEYYLLKYAPKDSIKILSDKMSKERVIEFEFQQDDKKDILSKEFTKRDYKSSVEYLSFKIRNDYKLVVNNKDTIKCSGVLFERNYKVAPFKRILLYFNGVEPDSKIKLIYYDNLFHNGILKFNFSERPIKL